MIEVCYGRQLLPGSFEHALSDLIDNEIDLGRFAGRFEDDESASQPNVGKVLVAMANKRARQVWAMLLHAVDYDPHARLQNPMHQQSHAA